MSDILTGTPPDLTYAHDLVRQAWMVVWAITSGALVVILGWMGLTLIMSEHLGRQQAGWREMVPRLDPGTGGRRIVIVVVRPGPRRGPRRLWFHRRIPEHPTPETCSARPFTPF